VLCFVTKVVGVFVRFRAPLHPINTAGIPEYIWTPPTLIMVNRFT
jgi:hypothetical protein